MELNGGSVVAMAGKNCVAIGCDLRLGEQFQTLATNFEKVYMLYSIFCLVVLLGTIGLPSYRPSLCGTPWFGYGYPHSVGIINFN